MNIPPDTLAVIERLLVTGHAEREVRPVDDPLGAERQAMLRRLPAVGQLLQHPSVSDMIASYPRPLAVEAVEAAVATLRRQILSAVTPQELSAADPRPDDLLGLIAQELSRWRPHLRRVINATGVILHTNLGRAVLSKEVARAVEMAATGYTNLEFDLQTGERGSRHDHVEGLLCRLTGAEAAAVVNNNAAAVLLTLSTLAAGREVVVSRGELVEIGGAFRIPDVMAQSGARLVEVGTTNKTRASDYIAAIGPDTAALLKVHQSNFRIVGFTTEVPLEELVKIGHKHGLTVIHDLGSGLLVDLTRYGIAGEPDVRTSVAAGADVVTFSGDKLLGGPQAGFILGRREIVARIKRHPLARAVRIDKLTLAAVEATLRLYLDPEKAMAEIPTLRMLTIPAAELEARARSLAGRVQAKVGQAAEVTVMAGASQPGGGSLPAYDLPTWLVCVRPAPEWGSAAALEQALRAHDPPVLARTQHGCLLVDPRTLLPGEDDVVVAALGAILVEGGGSHG